MVVVVIVESQKPQMKSTNHPFPTTPNKIFINQFGSVDVIDDRDSGLLFSILKENYDNHDLHSMLLQNCDLPPPNKVFAVVGPQETTEKMEQLLKAMRLSQTRAREAEKKRDVAVKVAWGEWMRGFGNRQLVRWMELEVIRLHDEIERRRRYDDGRDGGDDGGGGSVRWVIAVALVAGIGFGVAFGCGFLI